MKKLLKDFFIKPDLSYTEVLILITALTAVEEFSLNPWIWLPVTGVVIAAFSVGVVSNYYKVEELETK